MTVSQTDRAYAAGYFDADGSVSASLTGKSVSIQVSIANRDYAFLRRLENRYGGNFLMQKSGVGQWRIYGTTATIFLKHIYRYVSYKHEQVKHSLQIVTRSDLSYRSKYTHALQVCILNQKNMSTPKITKTITRLCDLLGVECSEESLFSS
jgi:hypothetical protein